MAGFIRTVSVTDTWAALPDLAAREVSILNNTGADLEARYASEDGADQMLTLKDGQTAGLPVVSKASEIEIRAAVGADGVQLIIE